MRRTVEGKGKEQLKGRERVIEMEGKGKGRVQEKRRGRKNEGIGGDEKKSRVRKCIKENLNGF